MKRLTLAGLTIVISLNVLNTACSIFTDNSNNHNNIMMNSNSSVNANVMDHNSMPMNANSNMSVMMDHSEMMSSPNAGSQPYDLQYIDTMSLHHQGAVQMAEMALKQSANQDVKAFAQRIIDDQEKEIAQMRQWRDKWYSGKPAAINMEMSGMSESMKMMSGSGMMKIQGATGKDFDVMFLDMMAPHHEGAIVMSKEASTKAEHPEIKTLASQIVKAQEAEIKTMKDWKAAWIK